MMRTFSFFVTVLLLSFPGSAQDPKPVIQTSHQSSIEFFDVNFQRDIMLTADKNEVILWNAYSGRQLRRIPLPFTIRGAAFCNEGQEVAVMVYEYGKDASVRFFDSRTGGFKDSIQFVDRKYGSFSYKPLDNLFIDDRTNRLIVKHFDNLEVMELSARRHINQLNLPSYDSKFSFTGKQDVYVTTEDTEGNTEIAVIDLHGKTLKKQVLPGARPAAIAISKTRDSLFVLNYAGIVHILNKELDITDSIHTGTEVEISRYSKPRLSISESGTKMLVWLTPKHMLYDLSARQWTGGDWKINYSQPLFFTSATADRAVKIVGEQLAVLDPNTGKELNRLDGKSLPLGHISFSSSGSFFSRSHAGSLSNYSDILDLRTGITLNELEMDFAIFQWLSDSVVLASSSKWNEKTNEREPGIQIKNIFTGQILQTVYPGKVEGGIDHAVISNDGKTIACVDALYKKLYIASGDKFRKIVQYNIPLLASRRILFTPDSRKLVIGGQLIRVLDITSGKWKAFGDTSKVYGYSYITVTPDSREIWFEAFNENTKATIYTYNLETNKLSPRRTYDTLVGEIICHPTLDLYATGFFNGTLELRKISNDELIYRGRIHNGLVKTFAFNSKNNWLASVGQDNMLHLLNYVQKEPIIAGAFLYKNRERGFALITPENYYLAPPSLTNELHYSKEYQTYSFAQFDLYLNRPDKVLERLEVADVELLDMHRKAYRRRLAKAGLPEDSKAVFTALRPLNVKVPTLVVTQDSVFRLSVSTDHPSSGIGSFLAYVNGQLIAEISAAGNTREIPVKLSVGVNNIEASYVTTDGIESIRERIEMTYAPVTVPQSETYYLGIGVSAYLDSAMNLKYAVKDVADIAEKFKSVNPTAKILLLTDTFVTRKNLAIARQFLADATINDKVVVSFSGHGLLDSAYNFYFAGWDMNFLQPAVNGISYNDITALLDIRARQKILLIDACHSGEVDKDIVVLDNKPTSDTQFVNSYKRSSIRVKKNTKLQNTVKLMERYFTDVSKSNGANIISAAAGEEYALESGEWNNGVFSFSFMQGLFDRKADTDHNGRVSQSELRRFMQQRVVALTGGRQQPTSRTINSDHDWEF